jgi:hypothetical protein
MNIRWDAVIDCQARAAGRSENPPPVLHAPDTLRAGNIQARVELYGVLASLSAARTIQLTLPATATIADMLTTLGESLGDGFLAHVLGPTGAKHRHCRLFVNGYPIEDMTLAIEAAAEPTQIEIILLVAPEGG